MIGQVSKVPWRSTILGAALLGSAAAFAAVGAGIHVGSERGWVAFVALLVSVGVTWRILALIRPGTPVATPPAVVVLTALWWLICTQAVFLTITVVLSLGGGWRGWALAYSVPVTSWALLERWFSSQIRTYRHDVFLSFSSDRRETARDLFHALEAGGTTGQTLRVWFDERELSVGQNWLARIEPALSSSVALICVVGDRGLGPIQAVELGYWLTRGREQILPVLVEGATEAQLGSVLGTLSVTRFVDSEQSAREVDELAREVLAMRDALRSW